MVRSATALVVKVSAYPGEVVGGLLERAKSGVVQRDKAAPTLHLLLQHRHAIADEQGMVALVVVGAVGVEHYAVRVIKCLL